MTHEQFQKLLRKYQQGQCSPPERKIIEDWFSALSTEEPAFLDEADLQKLKGKAWAHVEQQTQLATPGVLKPAESRTLRWPLIGVAASVLVLLLAAYYQAHNVRDAPAAQAFVTTPPVDKVIENKSEAFRDLELPEGNVIRLSPGSTIRYAESFSGNKREIYLEGEAFFDVAPDAERPFFVYTHDLTTKVLGTSFLIKAYKEQSEIIVMVKRGQVSVYTSIDDESGLKQPQQEVILSPNQEAVYHAGQQLTMKKLVKEPEVILEEPTLKGSYTNAPVIDILTSLEQNYGIDIHYDVTVLSNCTLTSDMSEEGFYEQIKIICNALGAQYKVEETTVFIEATGCSVH